MIELASRLENLSPAKRELLLRQLKKLKGEAPRPVILPRQQSLGDFPLSYAQQRLWFFDQLEPGNPFYNLPGAVRLQGPLDEVCLGRALSAVVARHESLRTAFPALAGRPVQRVGPPTPVPLPVVDLAGLPEEERRRAARALALSTVRRPFDLAAGPLLRAVLLRLAPEERILAFAVHHIVADGWSLGVLMRELTASYRAFRLGVPSPLPELTVQYADFCLAERRWLDGETLAPQLAFWRHQLADLPDVLELPADRPRPESQTFRGARQAVALPGDTVAALKELGQREKATPFMVLLAAFAALLHRYSSRDDVVLGTPVANRDRVETEGLIGLFFNTLVLRCDLAGNPSFRELLARVRETTLGAFAHPDLPFERLVEELQPSRDLAHTPIFQVLFAFQSLPPAEARGAAELRMESLPVETGRSLFDLTLTLDETPGRIAGAFEYNTDLFNAVRVRRMAAHLETLLAGIVRRPDERLSDLPLLPAAEQHQVAAEWSDTAAAYRRRARVHELIAARAQRDPEAIAIACAGRRLSFRELEARAGRLAGKLARLGAGPESRVGVCLERSPEMLVALLGVWRTGAAYVPMDPYYPEERLAYVLADAGISLLLADGATPPGLRHGGATVVDLDAEMGEGEEPLAASQGGAQSLAYVIYTSGSTGRPKGVEVTHGALVNFLQSMSGTPGLAAGDVLLAVTSLSFDIAGLELYLPLLVGARIELASREVAGDGARLLALLEESGATAMQATPATWRLLVDAGWRGGAELPGGIKVLCGGEALPERLAAELCARSESVWNLYGPTETTIWSAARRVWLGERVVVAAADRQHRPLPARRRAASGARGHPWRAVDRRRRSRARLSRPGRPDGRALPPRSLRGPAGSADLPHRRPRPLPGGRRDRVPGPGGPPGQGPRLPHRAGGGRAGAGEPSGGGAGGGDGEPGRRQPRRLDRRPRP